MYTPQVISNNYKTKSLFVNLSKNLRIFLSVSLCINSRLNREVLLRPNLVRRYPRHEVKTTRRDFFGNRSGFIKIQILSDLFLDFFIIIFLMGCIFSFKYCTFSILTASNKTENSLLNTICSTMIAQFIYFLSNF